MYDPSTAKFISEDPIGFDGGDDNLYRYVHNDPVNRIDPTGTSDVRFPFSSGVTNNSNQDVYIINSTERDDRIEVLHPGDSTPNSLGRSKDADGLWIQKPNGWKFYPLTVPGPGEFGKVYIDSDLNVWGSDPDDPRSYRHRVVGSPWTPAINIPTKPIKLEPWNGENPNDPNDDRSPASRTRLADSKDGLGIGTYPPDTRITYPDASEWEPVAPENTQNNPQNLLQNGLERFIDQIRRTSGDIWDWLTNPFNSDETTEGNVPLAFREDSQVSLDDLVPQDNSFDFNEDNQPPNPNRNC